MRITPVGTTPVNMSAITRTAPVGPRLQPEQKPERAPETGKDLRAQRDTLQNQLNVMKGTVSPDEKAVEKLEGKLQQVNDDLTASENGKKPYASALERLQGKQDTYEAAEAPAPDGEKPKKVTIYNTDDADREIESLKKKQEKLSGEVDAAGKRGDEEAWNRLVKELRSVQSELQQKDNDTARRQNASVETVLK